MPLAYKNLLNSGAIITALSDTVAAVATVPAGSVYNVMNIMIHNAGSADRTVTLYKVTNSAGSPGTPSAANEIFNQAIPPGEDILIEYSPPGDILPNEGDAIFAMQSAGTDVTIRITGREDT